jgi:hypothetical protein
METWIRASVDAVTERNISVGPIKSMRPTILMGFSVATKECQHIYGPFWDDQEFVDFAKLHSIDPTKVSEQPPLHVMV